jgi:hypothetical protein
MPLIYNFIFIIITIIILFATRQQVVANTPAKWSAYQIPSVIVVFVVLVSKV